MQQISIGCLFTYVGAYASMLLSPFISPSPFCSPPLSLNLFSMSASPLLCEQIHQYHPSWFHIYALKYNICFSLFDLLHCLIGSSFIHFIKTDSKMFLFMAEFHIVLNCSLAMFWEGSWRYSTPFQFGLPVLVYTAETHSGWDLWGLWARCCPLFSSGPQGAPNPPLTHGALPRFAFRLGNSWQELCLLRTVRA